MVEKRSKKKSHKFDMPKLDLMLPCDSISTASSEESAFSGGRFNSGANIMMLDGSMGSEGDLETEVVTFQEKTTKFNSSLEFKTIKDHETEVANLVEQFPSLKSKLSIKKFLGSKSTGSTSPTTSGQDSVNGEASYSAANKHKMSAKEKEKLRKRRSPSGEDAASLQSHVLSIESQMHNQVGKCLEKKTE